MQRRGERPARATHIAREARVISIVTVRVLTMVALIAGVGLRVGGEAIIALVGARIALALRAAIDGDLLLAAFPVTILHAHLFISLAVPLFRHICRSSLIAVAAGRIATAWSGNRPVQWMLLVGALARGIAAFLQLVASITALTRG